MSENTEKKKTNKKKIVGLSIVGAIVLAIAVLVIVLVSNAGRIPKTGADFANGKWFVVAQADTKNKNVDDIKLVVSFEIDTSKGYDKNQTVIKYVTQNATGTGENPPETINCGLKTTGEISKVDLMTINIGFVDSDDSGPDPYLTVFRAMQPFGKNVAYVHGNWDLALRKAPTGSAQFVDKSALDGSYLCRKYSQTDKATEDKLTIEGTSLTLEYANGSNKLVATVEYDETNDIGILKNSSGTTVGYILENDKDSVVISVLSKNMSNSYNNSVSLYSFKKA